jgi:hypothetical protein
MNRNKDEDLLVVCTVIMQFLLCLRTGHCDGLADLDGVHSSEKLLQSLIKMFFIFSVYVILKKEPV